MLIGLAVLAVGAWVYAVSNVEHWKYGVVAQDGAIEIRDYPALVVAEITRRGDRNSAVRAGFGPLAGYIFAKNRVGESISMTAPVTQALSTGYTGRNWYRSSVAGPLLYASQIYTGNAAKSRR